MPLPMVHLSIAKGLLNRGMQVESPSQFYLGTISPDAIHMRQDTNRLDKNKTHLIQDGVKMSEVDKEEFEKHIIRFICLNKKRIEHDFLWGYCVHVLTDLYWTQSIYAAFVEKYQKDNSSIQEERQAYYNDADILDLVLYNESEWRDEVWRFLHKASGQSFLELLSAEEIDDWNNRILHWYDSSESQHKNPIKYITKDDVSTFIETCTDTIWNKILLKT